MFERSQLLTEKLISFQKAKNLTQHQMAEHLKIGQATYNNWINGRTIIAIKYYQSIAVLCGIELKEVIPPEMEVTFSMPNSNTTFTTEALALHQKLNYHLEGRLEFQMNENERLRKENEELRGRLNGLSARK